MKAINISLTEYIHILFIAVYNDKLKISIEFMFLALPSF